MSRNETVLYTTFYPAIIRYLPKWWESVRAQSDPEFDLCIGLDGMRPEEAETAIGDRLPASWLSFKDLTPASIRQQAFLSLTEQYKSIVLVDADDVLYPTRIEAARRALSEVGMVGCALRLIDSEGSDLGAVFAPKRSIESETFLLQHNVFGLSNTAYRADVLKRCLPLPANCLLIDWLLATRVWALEEHFSFDHTPHMFYRQYADNTARVIAPFSPSQVLTASSRVLSHYECLLDTPTWLIPRKQREALMGARYRAGNFHQSIERSPAVLSEYVAALNRLEPEYVWWWCVAHSDLESIWKN